MASPFKPRPTISVAMATYNGARFLYEQLASIANQTVYPAELIICDDGSHDETISIASKFADEAPFPVQVHRNPRNLGFARNFREAASRCRGDLIAFSDQDDWWCPDRLEKCLPSFEDPDVLLIYHNAWLVDADRFRFGTLYEAAVEQQALRLHPVGPWNHSYGLVQIFRSSLRIYDDLWDWSLNHMADPQDILSHDQWYFFLAEALGRVKFLDDRLLEYRQHERNDVGAKQMKPAIQSRLFARVEHYGCQDLRISKAATARASILREIASRTPDSGTRLRVIAACYEHLAERSGRRYHVYSRERIRDRLACLVHSWRKNDYSEWPWGFDRRSVYRDLLMGVLFGLTEPAG